MQNLVGMLFLASLLLAVIGLVYPPIFEKLLKKIPSRKSIAIFFGSLLFFLFILIGASAPSIIENDKTQPEPSPTSVSYEIIAKEDAGSVENIDVLIAPNLENPENVAQEIRSACRKPCNISIFDDRKALDLQAGYDDLMRDSATTLEDLESWKSKNYIYVADHLVGYSEF